MEGVEQVNKRLEETIRSLERAGSLAVQMTAAQCVVYAKQRAPWTDRTGNARRSIHSEASNQNMTAAVGIGVFYGKYLEKSNGGRYRVIDPTVFSYGRVEFMKNLKGIM